MRLATWNINGVNRRLDILLRWLDEAKPDVLCLQELKCTSPRFPVDELQGAGYGAVWHAEGRWNGVAILCREKTPILTCLELPCGADDRQARYIEAAIDGVIVGSVYAPNGNPQPGPKYDYKLAWMERLCIHAEERLGNGIPFILAGDFNVVRTPRDIYETKSYDNNAMIQPAAISAVERLLRLGLTDIQNASADPPDYTFWDYRRQRWERNAICVQPGGLA